MKITLEEITEARELAWEAYAKSQENNEVPAWIVLNGGTSERRLAPGVWAVSGFFFLYKHHTLPPGIAWERGEDGLNELVSRNLETGERTMLLSYDVKDEERIDFFEAEVDLPSRTSIVKHSTAADHLSAETFMLRFDNFDLTKSWRFDRSTEQNRLDIFSDKSR